jgi:hypothetical protein
MECSSVMGYREEAAQHKQRRLKNNKKKNSGDKIFLFFFFFCVCLPSPPFDPATCCLPTSGLRDTHKPEEREKMETS